jgi:hypothetical protein
MFTDFNALFTKCDHANQKNSTNLNNKKKNFLQTIKINKTLIEKKFYTL